LYGLGSGGGCQSKIIKTKRGTTPGPRGLGFPEALVQEGIGAGGNLIRWSFSEIKAKSFRWRGELSADDGATWRLNVEFFARRVDPA
jgi:hypothetical protein